MKISKSKKPFFIVAVVFFIVFFVSGCTVADKQFAGEAVSIKSSGVPGPSVLYQGFEYNGLIKVTDALGNIKFYDVFGNQVLNPGRNDNFLVEQTLDSVKINIYGKKVIV